MIQPQIQVAAVTDLPLVAELDAAIFGKEAYSDEQWNSEFTSAAVTILIAAVEGIAVGFCSGAAVGDDYEIRKIGVMAAHRRSGIAKQLLHSAVSLVEPLPARCLIDVAATNTGAISFYARAGFGEVARRKRYYANGDDAIIMQKKLRGRSPQ